MTANDSAAPRKQPGTTRITRRTLLQASAAAGALAAMSADPASAHGIRHRAVGSSVSEPWTNYIGANRLTPMWGQTTRDFRIDLLPSALQTHDVVFGIDGFDGVFTRAATQADFDAYMAEVEATGGDAARQRALDRTRDVVAIQDGAPHKVIAGEMGNETNAAGIRQKFTTWAAANGRPYPHPGTPYVDPAGDHDRGYIGYFAEYFLVPTIEGRLAANAEVGPEDQIPLMCSALAGARHPRARDWLEALLNYEFSGEFGPTLTGQLVSSQMDLLSIHYLLTPDPLNDDQANSWQANLQAYQNWVGVGAISGVWHTEEGGNQARDLAQLASVSQRVFARGMDWALSHNTSSDLIRLLGFYLGTAPEGTRYEVGMDVLFDFLGLDAMLVNRSAGVTADVNNAAVETYGFETHDGGRRVLFVTPVKKSPAAQGETVATSVTTAPDGWHGGEATIQAQAHLFRTTENSHETPGVSVTGNGYVGYTITLAQPIDLNADNGGATLEIHLTHLEAAKATAQVKRSGK